MKRMISATVSLLLLLGTLASCSGGETPAVSDTDGTEPVDSDGLQQDSEVIIPSSLPETMDFGGENISILCREDEANSAYFNEIGIMEEGGDIINDAIYRRNRSVEERLNVTLEPINMDGCWSNQDAFMTRIRNDVLGGTNELDIIVGYAAYISTLATEGMLCDLSDPPNMDYSKPWWNSDIIDNAAAAGRSFFVAGDIGISYLNSAYMIYYNKQLAEDLSLPSLYETVRTGKWTTETVMQYTKLAGRDLNGDNEMDLDNDRWGFVANQAAEYTGSFDIHLIEIDNGSPRLSTDIEKAADALTWLNRFFYEDNGAAPLDQSAASHEIPMKIFEEGRALFYSSFLGRMIHLRGMNEDFGVLPQFKWDESQEDYLTIAHDGLSLFAVPKSCDNFDAATAVMEALAEEGYRSVLPAYYEKALGSKFTRDEESAEMLDIIREGLTFRFELVYASNTNHMQNLFNSLVQKRIDNFASYYAQNQSIWSSLLENLADTIAQMKD